MKRKSSIRTLCATLFMCISSGSAFAAIDRDEDKIADLVDNCIGTHNPLQRDTDADGFGNFCDPDLNNNNIVDKEDFSLFFIAREKRDLNADFNGDGAVDDVDLSILEQRFQQQPGPSNITPNPELVNNPPSIDDIRIYTTDVTLKNGSNGVGFIKLSREQKLGLVISQVLDNQVAPFNDAGIEPDLEPGDGIYSGFMRIDIEQVLNDEAKYLKRLQSIDRPIIKEFSGRAVVDQHLMPVDVKPVSGNTIKLASGITLTPLPTTISTLPALASTVNSEHSLMITHPSVIADNARTFDPCDVDGNSNVGNVNGAWSFKTLMTNMANTAVTGISAQQFTHDWLLNWMSTQSANGFSIDPRTNIQNFFPGWDAVNPATLNMNMLPFRIIAIVNRMDLGQSLSYGPGNPGETRLIYGLVDLNSPSCSLPGNTGAARQMTVIFEYGDTGTSCTDQKSRAQAWIDLDTHTPLPNAAYNAALQALTDTVTVANANPSKPNGSAINQVRTNEIALSSPWQLREFVLEAPASSLVSATIKQTPDPGFPVPNFRFGSAVTAAFWEDHANDILCEQHVVPEIYMAAPFLGSHAEYGPGTFWDAPTDPLNLPATFPSCYKSNVSSGTPTVKGAVRHKFSLNTCDDCHAGETNTVFTHVDPGSFPSFLSSFLTGAVGAGQNPVNDPGGEPVQRSFDDLTRRGQALDEIATKSCFSITSSSFAQKVSPLSGVH